MRHCSLGVNVFEVMYGKAIWSSSNRIAVVPNSPWKISGETPNHQADTPWWTSAWVSADWKTFRQVCRREIWLSNARVSGYTCGSKIQELGSIFVCLNLECCGRFVCWVHGPCPNYGSADPPQPIRTGHLDIKDAQWAKKMMGAKFHITSYRVWHHGRPKGAFWVLKNSTLSIRGQICREDWNCSHAHFSHEWLFLCDS